MELFYKQNINNKKCSSTLQNMGLPLTNKKNKHMGTVNLAVESSVPLHVQIPPNASDGRNPT
jgi:hypothetical protein